MATIIKNESRAFATGNPVREVAYDLTDFSGQAEDYLDRVRAEATKIVQKAKHDAATIRSQAESAGRQAAQEAIEKILDEKVANQMRSLTPALQTAIKQIVDSRSSWQHHWEGAVVDLACGIAARIIRQEISKQPEISLTWIRQSLELAGGAAEITLHMHPSDLVILRNQSRTSDTSTKSRGTGANCLRRNNCRRWLSCRNGVWHHRYATGNTTRPACRGAGLSSLDANGTMKTAYPPHLDSALLAGITGSVAQTIGLTAAVADFPVPIGALVKIEKQSGETVEAEVIGFRDKHTLVMPLSRMEGIRRGSPVRLVRTSHSLRVGNELLGRVVDARGRCIDGRPQPMLPERRPLECDPLTATERPRIDAPLATGVRAIDGLLTCGRGQRLGIFAGSGVGKSVLMGMMGRYTDADVAVIGLIGERGREVNEFIHRELGPAGLARSVVVVATSNDPASDAGTGGFHGYYHRRILSRCGQKRAPDYGLDNSVCPGTKRDRSLGRRTTHHARVSSLGVQHVARLVERAGRTKRGSITAFYSVLVEGDDENEPIADTMRGLLGWACLALAAVGRAWAFPCDRPLAKY